MANASPERESSASAGREELIKGIRDQIRGALGIERYNDTLNQYRRWATLGDKVWGAAVWFVVRDEEERFQIYQTGDYQRKISERLGLSTDWRALAPARRPPEPAARIHSELLEAVVGRLCSEDPRRRVPVGIVEAMLELLSEDEKKVARLTPVQKFEARHPGYKVVQEKLGPGRWRIRVLDPEGQIFVETESKRSEGAKKRALAQAQEKLRQEKSDS